MTGSSGVWDSNLISPFSIVQHNQMPHLWESLTSTPLLSNYESSSVRDMFFG